MQKHRKRAFILRGYKIHKRLVIKQIVKRFFVKKGIYPKFFKNRMKDFTFTVS